MAEPRTVPRATPPVCRVCKRFGCGPAEGGGFEARIDECGDDYYPCRCRCHD